MKRRTLLIGMMLAPWIPWKQKSKATITEFTNGSGHWIRATWDASTNETVFYTSGDSLTTNPGDIQWATLDA